MNERIHIFRVYKFVHGINGGATHEDFAVQCIHCLQSLTLGCPYSPATRDQLEVATQVCISRTDQPARGS